MDAVMIARPMGSAVASSVTTPTIRSAVTKRAKLAEQREEYVCELYRHYDAKQNLLYVGVSLSALVRLGEHRANSSWFDQIARVEIEQFATREAALAAEAVAVEKEQPRYNKHLKRPTHREKVSINRRAAQARYSRADLVEQVVRFRPVYTLKDAAQVLGVRQRDIRCLCERKELGHFELPPIRDGYNPRTLITGWQLLEYLEARSVKANGK